MKKRLNWFTLILTFVLCLSLISCTPADDEVGQNEYVSHRTAKVTFATERVTEIWSAIVSAAKAAEAQYLDCEISYSMGECTQVYASYRIPSASLDQVLDTITALGDLEYREVRTWNLEGKYAEAESKRSALTERRAALVEMLNDSTLTADERIEVNREMSSVNMELDELERALRYYAKDESEAFVEVTVYTPTSPWVAIGIFALMMLLQLAGPAAMVLVIVLIARKRRQKKQESGMADATAELPAIESLADERKQNML